MGLLQRKRAIQPRDSGNAVFRQHDSRWWDIMANPPLAEPIDEVKFLAVSEKPRPKGLSLQLLFRGLKPPASTEVGLPSALSRVLEAGTRGTRIGSWLRPGPPALPPRSDCGPPYPTSRRQGPFDFA